MEEFLGGIRQVDCSSICSKAAEMGADFVKLANCKDFDNIEATTDALKAFFTELKNVNAEFGYRSATEIFRFISQAHNNDDTAEKMESPQHYPVGSGAAAGAERGAQHALFRRYYLR